MGVYALIFISHYSTFSKPTHTWTQRRHFNVPFIHTHTYIYCIFGDDEPKATCHNCPRKLVGGSQPAKATPARRFHLLYIKLYCFSIIIIFIWIVFIHVFVKLNFSIFAFAFVGYFSLRITELAAVGCLCAVAGLLVSCIWLLLLLL